MTKHEQVILMPPVDIAGRSAELVALMARHVSENDARYSTKYSCQEAVALEYGSVFTRARPVPDQLRGKMKRCYSNAQTFRHRAEGLVYCAGYALPPDCGDLIFEHAWVVDAEGCVIDPTWKHSPLTGYVGVPLKDAHATRMLLARTDTLFGVAHSQMWAHGLPDDILHHLTQPPRESDLDIRVMAAS